MTEKTKKTVRFLLVEDNEDHAELISKIFAEKVPHAVLERVEDGELALAYLHQQGEFKDAPRPDVILLDLNLPGLDGISVLKEIKGDVAFFSIPVVILTTSDIPRDLESAYDWSANSFITKPVDYGTLTETVGQLAQYWSSYNQPPVESSKP